MKSFMQKDLKICDITFAGRVFAMGNPMHKNRYNHGLALHIGGNKSYDFSGNILTVSGVEIIFMPKGSDYFVTVYEASPCYCVNFDVTEEISLSPFIFKPKNTRDFIDCFKRIDRVRRTKSEGFEYKALSELYSILYNMKKEYYAGYIPDSKALLIRPALEYIHDKYTSETLNVSHLSSLCGITPEYFRKVFRYCHGTSPVKYITDLKLSRAKELMLSGMYSVSESAYLSGFSDISYFSREFKKNVGVPPSVFVTENIGT